jgi:predicted metal-binding protein
MFLMADDVEIFVCVSCAPRAENPNAPRPGAVLAQALNAKLVEIGASGITVREVECLAVCKRPSTIAMTAAGKWTYLVGDLLVEEHVGDIASAAVAFQRSPNGIVPWSERPAPFRKGVIARVPPLGFEQPVTETV